MAANSRFAVAVHVAAMLAYRTARGETWVSSERLAASVQTNPVVARRAVTALVRAGLAEAQPGPGGGARLRRPAAAISLAELYHAVEGARGSEGILAFNPNAPNPHCVVSCGMRTALGPVFEDVEVAVHRALAGRTLADIVAAIPQPRTAASSRD